MFLDFEGESFYQFAMALFMEAGHVFTSTPEYHNHTAERFAYFDNKPDTSLSPTNRALLKRFNNVSRLFTVNGCAFFSINLFTRRPERSELAHNIHTMLHPIIDADGTICLFRFEDEVMLSFMGFGYRCILSDWYPMFDPYDKLLDRLDIINMSINSGREYFNDLVYNLAREYYVVGTNASAFTVLPINALSRLERDEISRDDLDEIIRDEMFAAYRQYGDDYVEYDESAPTRREDIGSDLDLMLLDMDMENDDNPFGEDIEDDDFGSDEDDFLTRDEYEFADVDPEVFKDPTLLVKLLKRQALGSEENNLLSPATMLPKTPYEPETPQQAPVVHKLDLRDTVWEKPTHRRNEHEPMIENETADTSEKEREPVDPLIDAITTAGLEFRDKRDKGGCLWVFGGFTIQKTIRKLEEEYEVNFRFKADGPSGSDTPAWWTTDK